VTARIGIGIDFTRVANGGGAGSRLPGGVYVYSMAEPVNFMRQLPLGVGGLDQLA
jgi:hypothetical protein